MKFCQSVTKKRVLPTAMKLVQSAKKEILVSMNVDEELDIPLPDAYHTCISRKIEQGIVVKRFAFGSKRVYQKLKHHYKGVHFYYCGDISHYQRMLITDKKRGLFDLDGTVFYTTFIPLISSLVKYIKIIYYKPA